MALEGKFMRRADVLRVDQRIGLDEDKEGEVEAYDEIAVIP